MAAATTLSSSPLLINVRHKPIAASPLPSLGFHLLRRLNRRVASIRRPQSRRRYEPDDRFFDGYEYDVVPDDEADEFSDGEDETESSVDLLIRFLRSMYRKISKRAKKASRRILPAAMSPQLVSFAVDGILLLASLSITRAFLEVICNLGGTVFVVILLIRLIWAAVSYFQAFGNGFHGGRSSFGGEPQPL
ncbi:PREDICTED: uncharacterized protein LOC104822080 [Tarenaya hassleriana]|uniref:uncharacterized protein LOC104822080 n=1 Tax=Tarenaya hassleriana TaxID=28532 RepID=UPI00053C996E|nr:PREDICTED: uncharacterized protein LOC104822080 [Tarenaya hassleriana]